MQRSVILGRSRCGYWSSRVRGLSVGVFTGIYNLYVCFCRDCKNVQTFLCKLCIYIFKNNYGKNGRKKNRVVISEYLLYVVDCFCCKIDDLILILVVRLDEIFRRIDLTDVFIIKLV